MNINVEQVVQATPEVHDLIGELNDVLGAAYEAHQRHGLSIEQLLEPHVRFFLARLDGLAVGLRRRRGVRRLRRGQAHVHPANGTWTGSCKGSSAQDRGRSSWGGCVGLAPGNGNPATGSDRSLPAHGVSTARSVRRVCGNASSQHRDEPLLRESCFVALLIRPERTCSISCGKLRSGVTASSWSKSNAVAVPITQGRLSPPRKFSTHAGVAIAVARLVADVRVYQPSAQQALSNEPRFFQHAGRTDILDIAHRANAEYRSLT